MSHVALPFDTVWLPPAQVIGDPPSRKLTVPPLTFVFEFVVSVTVAVRVTTCAEQDPEKRDGQINAVFELDARLVVVKSADDGGVKVMESVQPLMDTESHEPSSQSGFSSEMYSVQVPTGSDVLV